VIPPKRLLWLAALVVMNGCATADTLELPTVFATPPKGAVKRWVWFQIVSIRNHGVPIVYISTQRFKSHLGEALIVLSQSRFDSLAKLTDARLTRFDCAARPPPPYKPVTLEVALHENAPTRTCLMPSATACEFLAAVTKLPAMEWTERELSPIAYLRRELPQCP
jgi:hypothetical protein